MYKHTLLIKLLKEPLLHFLLIGFGLFLLSSQSNTEENNEDKTVIHIQKSALNEMARTFVEENKKEATKDEKEVLLAKRIREEVLAREAMAMGLDKEDKVIRHRLAEKMSYLFEDVSLVEDANEESLRKYFKDNPKEFEKNAHYEDISQEVKEAWIKYIHAQENKVFYESLKNRYTIIVDEDK